MKTRDRSLTPRGSIGVASGIAMMTIPFLFAHLARVAAAILFDAGILVAAFFLILLLVEMKERTQHKL